MWRRSLASIPDQFRRVQPETLPESSGVLLVCCPAADGADAFTVQGCFECDNMKEFAKAHATKWASQCEGFLTYLIYVSNDPAVRKRIVAQVEQS